MKQWLKDRLRLDISPDKSSVVNLKKRYCEFLEFKLKAVKKRGKYTVYSNMSDKAVKRETQKLSEQIQNIRYAKSRYDKFRNIRLYNSMVWGIHNYYRYATNVNLDCMKIQFVINKVQYNRLDNIEKQGKIDNTYITEHYGKSKQLRFVCGFPLCPIGYIQTKNPQYKKRSVCKYTEEGRAEIHKNLKFDPYAIWCMHRLAEQYTLDPENGNYSQTGIICYGDYFKCNEALKAAAGAPSPPAPTPEKSTYEIYQLKSGDDTRDMRFISLERLAEQGKKPDISTYDKVYEGDFTPFEQAGATIGKQLEAVYTKFNLDHPADFKGHSLSVSDVVVAKGKAYYYGITLIPPGSISAIIEIMWDNHNLSELLSLFSIAERDNKFIIHFGR